MPAAGEVQGSIAVAPAGAQAACQKPGTPCAADKEKISKLVDLASQKKQSGNEALAAGRQAEALDFFEGALKALQYVVPAPDGATSDGSGSLDYQDSSELAEARSLQVMRRGTVMTQHLVHRSLTSRKEIGSEYADRFFRAHVRSTEPWSASSCGSGSAPKIWHRWLCVSRTRLRMVQMGAMLCGWGKLYTDGPLPSPSWVISQMRCRMCAKPVAARRKRTQASWSSALA